MLFKLFATPPNLDLYRLGNDYLRTFEPVWSGRTRDCKYRDLWLFCTFLQSRGLVATLRDLTRENVIAFIAWRLSAEEAPASVAQQLGHLSLQTTMKYTEQTDCELRETIEHAARGNNSRGDS